MTDGQIIIEILSDNRWHHVLDIMQRGKPGAINWAVRSRISDLKKKGCQIESRLDENGMAEYRLIPQVTYQYDNQGQGAFL